jgi:Pectinacetylesterase
MTQRTKGTLVKLLGITVLVGLGCSDDNAASVVDAPLADARPVTADGSAGNGDAPPLLADAPAQTADAGNGTAIEVSSVNEWHWVDFPDSSCDEGTPTGIGINKSDKSDNVIIFLQGGGACWNYFTCFDLPISVHGPYGAPEFNADAADLDVGIFDRNATANPFDDWNFVYVPYCTSDIHGGDNVIVYTEGVKPPKTVHHVGHANILAYVARLAPTFPSAPKLVVSGASAGGFGAAINYATIRDAMAAQASYLVDDSGPLLEGNDINPDLRSAWTASWRLDKILDPLCGQDCTTDLSVAFTKLSMRYPSDRLALLSSVQDGVIRQYFLLLAEAFQTDLLKMATDVLDPTPNFRYFFISGDSHTMLGNIGAVMSGTTPLATWLSDDVNGGTFISAKPSL